MTLIVLNSDGSPWRTMSSNGDDVVVAIAPHHSSKVNDLYYVKPQYASESQIREVIQEMSSGETSLISGIQTRVDVGSRFSIDRGFYNVATLVANIENVNLRKRMMYYLDETAILSNSEDKLFMLFNSISNMETIEGPQFWRWLSNLAVIGLDRHPYLSLISQVDAFNRAMDDEDKWIKEQIESSMIAKKESHEPVSL